MAQQGATLQSYNNELVKCNSFILLILRKGIPNKLTLQFLDVSISCVNGNSFILLDPIPSYPVNSLGQLRHIQ